MDEIRPAPSARKSRSLPPPLHNLDHARTDDLGQMPAIQPHKPGGSSAVDPIGSWNEGAGKGPDEPVRNREMDLAVDIPAICIGSGPGGGPAQAMVPFQKVVRATG